MPTTTVLLSGGYTHDDPTGVRLYDASDPKGDLVELGGFDDLEHPSYLAAHPHLSVVYAVSEVGEFDGRPGGGIVALTVDAASGALDVLDRASSLGRAPCHLSVTVDGSALAVANYASGSIAVYDLEPDGRFGPLRGHHQHAGTGPHARQEGPHAHCVRPDPRGRSLYALDLGTDQILRYDLGAAGMPRTQIVSTAPGAGPRQLVFHPTEPRAFVINELDNTLTEYRITEPGGDLEPTATTATLPADADSSIAADVQIHPDGHLVYASNRGHDSIAIFDCADPDDPLRLLGRVDSGGRTPRSTVVHPSGETFFVANQDSDAIVSFGIGVGGELEARGVVAQTSAPTCLITAEMPT